MANWDQSEHLTPLRADLSARLSADLSARLSDDLIRAIDAYESNLASLQNKITFGLILMIIGALIIFSSAEFFGFLSMAVGLAMFIKYKKDKNRHMSDSARISLYRVEITNREKKENEQLNLYYDLVDISGVSDKIARTLMDQYPTVKSINDSTAEQLADIPGVGINIARAIKARLG